MLDHRPDDPDDRGDHGQKGEESSDASQRPADLSNGSQLRVVVVALTATFAILPEEIGMVVLDLGMLRQKLRERRVGLEVTGIAEQRRIEREDAGKRRRILLKKLVQSLLGLLNVAVVRRLCRRPRRLRGA